jgi:hypothetical protein
MQPTFGGLFQSLTSTSVDLLLESVELACNVGSVTIKYGAVAISDLTGVVQNNNLGNKGCSFLRGVAFGVTANISSTDILDGNVLDARGSEV